MWLRIYIGDQNHLFVHGPLDGRPGRMLRSDSYCTCFRNVVRRKFSGEISGPKVVMIRRDYILRMIEEFIQALARIRSLKQGQRWNEAGEALGDEFKRLIGGDPKEIARLSETDLLARLAQDGPTQAVRDKTFLLATLLKEAGDVATAEARADEARECYLKSLHLLLEVLGREDVFECPEFVPKVELLRHALEGTPLPMGTRAMLIQHYERTGEFAKGEDELFALLDAEPDNDRLLEFGAAFYRRLLAQGDTALNEANLPRAEVEEGLKELEARRKPTM